jgi:hypothetical protein
MTKEKKMKSRACTLKNREDEARFRDTHNFSNYMKKLTPLKGTVAPHRSKGSVVKQTADTLKSNNQEKQHLNAT